MNSVPFALHPSINCAIPRVQQILQTTPLPLFNPTLPAGLILEQTDQGLCLTKTGTLPHPERLHIDFSELTFKRRSRYPHRELLIQAIKVRCPGSPLIFDTTAGLGRDGFLLAAAGFTVFMIERDPIIAALLADALHRAQTTCTDTANRITLVYDDSCRYLAACTKQPDAIYLDPMFPQRHKSAKVKQNLQLLQLLEKPEKNTEQLLEAALNLQPRKVVVKRPLKGPEVTTNPPPSYTVRGKAIRFDVYLGRGQQKPSQPDAPNVD